MSSPSETAGAQERFGEVFSHLGRVAAYARRRGSSDADALAAEAMTIAWRRLADVPRDDPLPWLYATARNLVLAEGRRARRERAAVAALEAPIARDAFELDPALRAALLGLSALDREALLLVAWEESTPRQAAQSLGINPTAFRVRLFRARRRLAARLDRRRPQEPDSLGLSGVQTK